VQLDLSGIRTADFRCDYVLTDEENWRKGSFARPYPLNLATDEGRTKVGSNMSRLFYVD